MVFQKMNKVKKGALTFLFTQTWVEKSIRFLALSDQNASSHCSIRPLEIMPQCQAVHRITSGEEHQKIKQKRNGKRKN